MPVEIGSRKQVFVDWRIIDAGYGLAVTKDGRRIPLRMPHGIRLVAHSPTVMPEPTFRSELPWESRFVNAAYTTLLQEQGVLRMYYEAHARSDRLSDLSARTCYAESDDGRHWRRNPVRAVSLEGSLENNIVFSKDMEGVTGAHGTNVFKDPIAPPEERYKLVCTGPAEVNGKKEAALWGAVSPDGIHFKKIETPLVLHPTDTQNVVQYDEDAGLYRAYLRGIWPSSSTLRKGIHGRRCIAGVELKDFRNWPRPQTVMAPLPDDPPDWDIYSNGYVKWPGTKDVHLLFPVFFCRCSDLLEIHLAVSRDGFNWNRLQKGPILPAGEPGTYNEGGMFTGQGIAMLTERGLASTPDEATLWAIPVAPWRYTHNYLPDADLHGHLQTGAYLATVRPDGFTSITADSAGECWTYPLTWDGDCLKINSWARTGGGVRVGLETKEGPVAGYTAGDCDLLEGDCLWKPVTWRGKSDLSHLKGQDLILHFNLLRCRLHAFRFAEAKG